MHINLVLSKSAEEVNVKISFLPLCSFNKLACLSIMQKSLKILTSGSHHCVTQGGVRNSKLCPL